MREGEVVGSPLSNHAGFDNILLRVSSDQTEMGDRLSVRQSQELWKFGTKLHRETKKHGCTLLKLLFSANSLVHTFLLRQRTSHSVILWRIIGGVKACVHQIMGFWAISAFGHILLTYQHIACLPFGEASIIVKDPLHCVVLFCLRLNLTIVRETW